MLEWRVAPSARLPCRYCFSLGEVADEYTAAVAGKLPKPKVEVMKVLAAAVAVAGARDAVKTQIQLVPLLAKAAMEPAPEVRETALQARSHRHFSSRNDGPANVPRKALL